MFDCGEGTQRQMQKVKIGFNRPMKIFITHLHGDHVLGLPGLIQSMSFLGRDKPLEIYGPKGLKGFLDCSLKWLKVELSFHLTVRTVREGLVYEDDKILVRALRGRHGVINYAYRFDEKPKPGKFNVKKASELKIPKGPLWKMLQMGKSVEVGGRVIRPEEVVGPPRRGASVGISGDTRPLNKFVEFFKDIDLLIYESTYGSELAKLAKEYTHSTSVEAAKLAANCNAKALVLTHFSNRYKDVTPLLEEAKAIFPNIIEGKDLMSIELREGGISIDLFR